MPNLYDLCGYFHEHTFEFTLFCQTVLRDFNDDEVDEYLFQHDRTMTHQLDTICIHSSFISLRLYRTNRRFVNRNEEIFSQCHVNQHPFPTTEVCKYIFNVHIQYNNWECDTMTNPILSLNRIEHCKHHKSLMMTQPTTYSLLYWFQSIPCNSTEGNSKLIKIIMFWTFQFSFSIT